MKKALSRIANTTGIYHYVDGKKVEGPHSNISGDVSNISGDVSDISGNVSNISGDVSYIRGNVSYIRGNVSNISGDVSHISGNVSNISGDLDKCGITDEDRKNVIDINDLIMDDKEKKRNEVLAKLSAEEREFLGL